MTFSRIKSKCVNWIYNILLAINVAIAIFMLVYPVLKLTSLNDAGILTNGDIFGYFLWMMFLPSSILMIGHTIIVLFTDFIEEKIQLKIDTKKLANRQ